MKYITGHKYRLYPTKKQAQILTQEFGNARYVTNNLLVVAKENKFNFLKSSKLLTEWRSEIKWLGNGYRTTQQNALMDLKTAFKNFFKGTADYPTFKKKSNRQSIRFSETTNVVGENYIYFSKKIGNVTARITREILNQPKELTISRTPDGKYYVSFCVEEEKIKLERKTNSIGIDLGLTDMVTLSDGTKIKNPKWLRKKEKRLVRYQRKYAKNKLLPKSNRKEKLRRKQSQIHQQVSDARKDFNHKLSWELIEKFQVLNHEGLAINEMLGNKKYSKSIQQAGWGQLLRFLTYKAEWYGREINEVDQWFASSKICHCCGWKKDKLGISEREWTCLSCGVIHDRDINAAININMAGSAKINAQEDATTGEDFLGNILGTHQRTVNLESSLMKELEEKTKRNIRCCSR